MPGVENRFLEPTAEPEALARGRGGVADERSLLLEEKLNEIALGLFDDLLQAFRTVRAYAERKIVELEASRPPIEHRPELTPTGTPADAPSDPPSGEFFREERSTYEAKKAELVGNEGRFVVIKGEEVAGVWPSYEEALDGGYDRFGPVPFFVKQITSAEHGSSPARHLSPRPV